MGRKPRNTMNERTPYNREYRKSLRLEAVTRLANQGLSLSQIAQRTGYVTATIKRDLKTLGIKAHNGGKTYHNNL